MPCASSRSSWMVSWTSPASWSSISMPASGSSTMMSLASRRLTASATRCCCAPSWRLRSTRRRSASPLATILARDSRSASACLRTSSSVVCSAVSSWELWRASPTCRARSVEHPVVVLGERVAIDGRSTTMRPSSSPPWLIGATRTCSALAPLDERRQPDRRPGGARHAGPRHDGALPRRHDRATRAQIGHRRRPLEDLTRSGVDLGAGEAHRLAERLGQLQQQLVHGDGAGEPAAEGPQHLVGGLP